MLDNLMTIVIVVAIQGEVGAKGSLFARSFAICKVIHYLPGHFPHKSPLVYGTYVEKDRANSEPCAPTPPFR